MSQMSTNVLRDWHEVEALAERWSALLERSHANSIFLTPEWIFAWRKAMQGIDLEPVVVIVEASDGELLGVAPFYLGVQYLVNAVPYRVLRVMGDFPTGSVYSDVIACPDQEQAVYEQVMAELVRFPCDGLWVPHVAPWTGASERLEQAAQRNGFSVDIRDSEFYVIDLPDTFEAYEMKAFLYNFALSPSAHTKRPRSRSWPIAWSTSITTSAPRARSGESSASASTSTWGQTTSGFTSAR